MTFLKINRLIAVQRGVHIYDEKFNTGVNIIRVRNSIGKSAISNFISYGLGGEFNDPPNEVIKCELVFIEIDINNSIFTLKRKVSSVPKQPTEIYYGIYEEAVRDHANWLIYPYNETKNKESFSQVLFRIHGFPDAVIEGNDHLTISQVLRMLYIDRVSALDALMKSAELDSPLIRQTIGDFLFGVYDDSLLEDQISIISKKEELLNNQQKIKILQDVFLNINQTINIKDIRAQIADVERNIQEIDEAIASKCNLIKAVKQDEQFNRIKDAQDGVFKISSIISRDLEESRKVELEILDTKQFIEELKRQDLALSESLKTINYFDKLKAAICPSCESELKSEVEAGICHLCKQPINTNDNKSKLSKIKQELHAQIRESEQINKEDEHKLKMLKASIDANKIVLKLRKKTLNSALNIVNTDLESKYDELLVTKGKLLNKIDNLANQIKVASSFWSLNSECSKLRNQIDSLNQLIINKTEQQKSRSELVFSKISECVKILLKGESSYENLLNSADFVELSFDKNTYSLNNRNDFSANSLVILRNSIRFAIFFASLDLDFMRFPRFIFCDNMDATGMDEKRCKYFQRQIVALAESEQYKSKNFQLIFIASMVDESLNTPRYTIGGCYTPEIEY